MEFYKGFKHAKEKVCLGELTVPMTIAVDWDVKHKTNKQRINWKITMLQKSSLLRHALTCNMVHSMDPNTPCYNTDLDIALSCGLEKKNKHGILQRNYRKMTILWSFF